MELPHLGEHCSEATCNRLDFLPIQCDSCNRVFCSAHFSYDNHACCGNKRKDAQIPICPLCSQPVPTPPGSDPNYTVGEHIDKQCKSDTKKVYTNRCNANGCKRKELIPIKCSQCQLNFCLRHRHTTDHNCKTMANKETIIGAKKSVFKSSNKNNAKMLAAQAAEARRNRLSETAQTNNVVVAGQRALLQGNLSEDEALARALALSLMEADQTTDSRQQNQSVQHSNSANRSNNNSSRCSLS